MQTTPTKSETEPAPSKPITAKAPSIAPVPVPSGNGAKYSVELLEKARADTDAILKGLGSQLTGLSGAEADSRLKQVGTNEIAREKRQSALMRLLTNVKNHWYFCSSRWACCPFSPVMCGRRWSFS